MQWVLDVERAYVELATNSVPSWPDAEHLLAASGAVASHFLAVGSPRSFSIIGDGALSLEAHRAWFKPSDLRCTDPAVAEQIGGRVVSLAEALAADIVCVHTPIEILASSLRRGTHVNVLAAANLDPELLAVATVVDRAALPAIAAGFVDGRQLDELTVFRYQP